MAKCQCGREMLKANGCRFKRIVIHSKEVQSYSRIKMGDSGDWYEQYVGTHQTKRRYGVVIVEPKSDITTILDAISNVVRYVVDRC